MITKHLISALSLCVVMSFVGCRKKKDDTATPDTQRVESFSMTLNGTDYSGTYSTKTYLASQQYIDLIANCSGGAVAEFEATGSLSVGTYPINSSTTDRGFAVGIGTTLYYCSSCSVVIETHDTSARYFNCRVTGTMSRVGGGSASLSACRISVFY